MNKSYKPAIIKYLFFFTSVMIFILSYVGLKLKIDFMKKEKIRFAEKIETLNNEILNLSSKVQSLSAEARIRFIAENELGLISNTQVIGNIKFNKQEFEKLNEKIITK